MGSICSQDQVQESSGNILQEKPTTTTIAKPSQVPEKKKPLRVYGNHFNSDTRTILTLLDISGIKYEFEEVDIFKGEHREEEYL